MTTLLGSAGCCCAPMPRCSNPCGPMAYGNGMRPMSMATSMPLVGNCAPVSYANVQPAMLQPSGCNTGAAMTYRAPSLPTMPRRQALIQRVKLPELPKPQWPITRQYSQCIQDMSSAAATSTRSNFGSCNCNRCTERRQHCSCGSCNHCQATERSCAAPMSVFQERSCAAPECVFEQTCSAPASVYSHAGQSAVGQGSVYCESCGKVHHSETKSAETPEKNLDSQVAVPPPAPLPAPPPVEEPVRKKAAPNKPAQQPETLPSNQEAAPMEVPLPEVTPEATPLPEVTVPMPTAEELPMDATLPGTTLPGIDPIFPGNDPEFDSDQNVAPMPIIDLMSLQIPSNERSRSAVRRSFSRPVETETITVQPSAVTRKRVQ